MLQSTHCRCVVRRGCVTTVGETWDEQEKTVWVGEPPTPARNFLQHGQTLPRAYRVTLFSRESPFLGSRLFIEARERLGPAQIWRNPSRELPQWKSHKPNVANITRILEVFPDFHSSFHRWIDDRYIDIYDRYFFFLSLFCYLFLYKIVRRPVP